LLAAGAVHAAPALQSQDDPHPGIHHERWLDTAIPARIELVTIDLTSAEIALYATKESDRGLTTSALADRYGAQVGINGDSFSVAGYVPTGLAIGDSTPWSGTADDKISAVFHFRRVGEATTATIVVPEIVVDPATLPLGTQGAISGRPLLVRAGQPAANFDCDDPVTLACQRAPRTAVGLSADGNTLLLAVVDGWQASSLGLTAAELASFLQARGAAYAIALDGGSSSTLVMDSAVINSPSDGVERSVANQLAIKYGALPTGQLVGLVCMHDVFACRTDDTLLIPGAEVVLDDGRTQTIGSDAFYDFTNVTPRYACVTVHKAGYLSKTQCQTVESGIQTYNSVALEPGVDPPAVDAGIPDAPPADAPARDAAGDALGNPDAGTGGGCCDAQSKPGRPAILVGIVAFALARRRAAR
jgi:hypothetical protein